MNNAYIITEQDLTERGLQLIDYALDGTYIPAIIQRGLDISVDRICELNDKVGVDGTYIEKCSNPQCGREYVAPFRITAEFFRPTI